MATIKLFGFRGGVQAILTPLSPVMNQGGNLRQTKALPGAYKDIIMSVNTLRHQPEKAQLELSADRGGNIQERLRAMNKAGVSLEMAKTARNKVIFAYLEVIRARG